MPVRREKLLLFINLILAGVVLIQVASALSAAKAQQSMTTDNHELKRLYEADQADREIPSTGVKDWNAVAARDRRRYTRVIELYRHSQMHTGADYYYAAMIVQHGFEVEDYLLAHELCVIALTKGEARAKWLTAASEDRFLMSIGRSQRFGTQFRAEQGVYYLYRTDERVTDDLRRQLDAPSLAEAKAKEAKMNQKRQ